MKPLVLIVLLIAMMWSRIAASDITGYALVVDGDTITIDGTAIRLQGIDTPERNQKCERDGARWQCGRKAAETLRGWLKTEEVRCIGDAHDIYGRLIADCFVDGYSVNARLVYEGLALAYRRYSDQYLVEQRRAMLARRGLWAGNFIAPWDWRKGERL